MIWPIAPKNVWRKCTRGACPTKFSQKWLNRRLIQLIWQRSTGLLRPCEIEIRPTTPVQAAKLLRFRDPLSLPLPPRLHQQRVQLLHFRIGFHSHLNRVSNRVKRGASTPSSVVANRPSLLGLTRLSVPNSSKGFAHLGNTTFLPKKS